MTAVWEQQDEYHNGRVLFVDEPDRGVIPVGVAGAYTKHIDSATAREMAVGLLLAAARNDLYRPEPAATVVATNACVVVPQWLRDSQAA